MIKPAKSVVHLNLVKKIGGFRAWERSKHGNALFGRFYREYERRFIWIRDGRIELYDFYVWSKRKEGRETGVA